MPNGTEPIDRTDTDTEAIEKLSTTILTVLLMIAVRAVLASVITRWMIRSIEQAEQRRAR